jgi:GT2 family glycosyltransferase
MEVAVVTALAGERGGALNCAFRAARGRIIVLLGDDRLVEPDFLIRHLIHHSSVPSVVLGDRHRCVHTHVFPSSEPALVGITPQSAFEAEDLDYPERWASSVFDGGQNSRLVFEHFERERVVNPLSWVFFDRGNVSLPREAVMRVNGLDEVFPQCSHGGWRLEDKEFAYRLYKSGLPFRFDPRASAIRQLGPSSPRARSRRLGDLSYFFSRHPELDRSILEPIFLRDDAA